jgi:hypothetical protein
MKFLYVILALAVLIATVSAVPVEHFSEDPQMETAIPKERNKRFWGYGLGYGLGYGGLGYGGYYGWPYGGYGYFG